MPVVATTSGAYGYYGQDCGLPMMRAKRSVSHTYGQGAANFLRGRLFRAGGLGVGYQTAVEDGLNVFRHWFMWSAIERRPGHYDWDDYDRQTHLTAKNGIKTIIDELTHTVPDWAYRKFAHARQLRRTGGCQRRAEQKELFQARPAKGDIRAARHPGGIVPGLSPQPPPLPGNLHRGFSTSGLRHTLCDVGGGRQRIGLLAAMRARFGLVAAGKGAAVFCHFNGVKRRAGV